MNVNMNVCDVYVYMCVWCVCVYVCVLCTFVYCKEMLLPYVQCRLYSPHSHTPTPPHPTPPHPHTQLPEEGGHIMSWQNHMANYHSWHAWTRMCCILSPSVDYTKAFNPQILQLNWCFSACAQSVLKSSHWFPITGHHAGSTSVTHQVRRTNCCVEHKCWR